MALTEKDLEQRISDRIENVEHVKVIDISGASPLQMFRSSTKALQLICCNDER